MTSWILAGNEALASCAAPTGDEATLAEKAEKLDKLESNKREGEGKLAAVADVAKIVAAQSSATGKETIRQVGVERQRERCER